MSKRHGGRRAPEAPPLRLTAGADEIQPRGPLFQAQEQMREGWEGPRGPKPYAWYWDGCPNLQPRPRRGIDITGRQFGRFTVVGLLDRAGHGKKASWVVRCDCGQFEARTAKALRENPAHKMACQQCLHTEHLKRIAHFNRTGRWPDEWRNG